jgi:Flp pilus assembly protein TadB
MTSRTNVRDISPAVGRYLAELDERTAHLDPDERAEIISSIEDHIADALGEIPEPSPSQVVAVLAELGPVSSIVEVVPPPRADPDASDTWYRSAGFGAGALALLFAWLYPPLGLVLGLTAIVLGVLLLRRRRADRRPGALIALLGALAVIVTCIWALTSVVTHTGSGSGTGPSPAARSLPASPRS